MSSTMSMYDVKRCARLYPKDKVKTDGTPNPDPWDGFTFYDTERNGTFVEFMTHGQTVENHPWLDDFFEQLLLKAPNSPLTRAAREILAKDKYAEALIPQNAPEDFGGIDYDPDAEDEEEPDNG